MSESKPRCFENDGSLIAFDPAAEIPRHASILVTRFPPTEETFKTEDGSGWYSGPTSIAYLLYALRDTLPTSLEGKKPLEWAEAYLEISKGMLDKLPADHFAREINGKNCGLTCEPLCWIVTFALIKSDPSGLDPLWDHADAIVNMEDAWDEWVVGRAGYLYFLRVVGLRFPQFAPKIKDITERVIDAMSIHSPSSQDPWKYYDRLFLGAGHGWVGNLTQILLSDPSRAQQVRPWLLDCIRQQCDTGNWRTYADIHPTTGENPRPNTEDLVQFGHGAPGIVSSLLSVRHMYEGDAEFLEKLDQAIEKAQECIWKRGLLRKESCLQHGAAGNSLALLDPKRKESFMAVSTQEKVDEMNASGDVEPSNSGSGLHRGLAGRIWAMAELRRGRSGIFLSYNDV